MKNFFKSILSFFNQIRKQNSTPLIKKYNKWLLSIISVPTMLILILILVLTANSKKLQEKNLSTEIFAMANNRVSNILNILETQAYSILSDPQAGVFIFSDDVTQEALSSAYTQKLLNNSIKHDNSITAVHLYSFSNNYLLGTNIANYIENIPEKSIPWYQHYKKTGVNDFIIPTKNYSKNEICMVRSLSMNNKLYAFIIFYIDSDTLFSFKDDEDYVLISNSDNNILYSTLNDEQTTKELYNFYKKNKPKDISFFNSTVSETLSSSNLTLLMRLHNTDKPFIYVFITGTILIIILSLFLAVMLSNYLTNLFYSNVAKTISYLTNESGSVYDNSQDELEWIKNSIASLLNSNKELEYELSKSIVKLKNSQLAAMQMQANPHFLFNALNLANMHTIAMMGNDNEASKIIVLVSDLLYSSLNTRQYFVPISQEIDFAKKYIEIELIKYNYTFEVNYDIDDSILSNKTVRLTLQPLIENAFRHGIHKLPSSKKGVLTVIVKEQNKTIVFKICDNGNTSNKKLSEINEELDKDIYTIVDQNIGLKNVNSRIKILFGVQYGCKIYRDGDITVSEIIIPKQPN